MKRASSRGFVVGPVLHTVGTHEVVGWISVGGSHFMSGKHARTDQGEVFLIEHTILLANASKATNAPTKALLLQSRRFPNLHIFKLTSHLSLCAQDGSDLDDVEKLQEKLKKSLSNYRKKAMLATLRSLVEDGKTTIHRSQTVRAPR